jgi:hypothetical protein
MKVGERYCNISRDKRYIIKDLYKMQRNGVTGRNKRKERGKERKREREREKERKKSFTAVLREENQVRKCRYGVFESSLFWSQNEIHQKYYRRRLSD